MLSHIPYRFDRSNRLLDIDQIFASSHEYNYLHNHVPSLQKLSKQQLLELLHHILLLHNDHEDMCCRLLNRSKYDCRVWMNHRDHVWVDRLLQPLQVMLLSYKDLLVLHWLYTKNRWSDEGKEKQTKINHLHHYRYAIHYRNSWLMYSMIHLVIPNRLNRKRKTTKVKTNRNIFYAPFLRFV